MPIANWYPDPADSARVRWWDGEAWTEHTQPRPAPVVAEVVAAPVPAALAVLAPQQAHQQQAHQQPAHHPPAYQQPGYQQAYAGMLGSTPSGYAVEASPVQLLAGKAAVPVVAIDYGWAPATCTRHHRPATATRKVTFVSAVPGWTYVLILAGLLIFVIVASILRKKATARAWPLCDECLATRRRSMAFVWVGLGGILPLLWLASAADGGHGSAVAGVLMLVALVGLPLLAVTGAILGAWARIVGGKVTPDGLFVLFRPDELDSRPGATAAGQPGSGAQLLPS